VIGSDHQSEIDVVETGSTGNPSIHAVFKFEAIAEMETHEVTQGFGNTQLKSI
jgi:hypothetical protein